MCNAFLRLRLCPFNDECSSNSAELFPWQLGETQVTRERVHNRVANICQPRNENGDIATEFWCRCVSLCHIVLVWLPVPSPSSLTWPTWLLLQALVLKVGMDSIMASYFALFEVINHSFGEHRYLCLMRSPALNMEFWIFHPLPHAWLRKPASRVTSLHEHKKKWIIPLVSLIVARGRACLCVFSSRPCNFGSLY